MSPSGVSGISAGHFRTCRSIDELWIFRFGPATFKYGRALKSETTILSYPFLKFCLSTRFFFHHLVPHVCPSIWHIENSKVSLWNPRYSEKINCLSISQALFLLLCHFHMNLNTQTHDLLIFNLPLAAFYRQSLSREVINKSQGDLNSSNSRYFPLCPLWSISIVLFKLFFEGSISVFCVLIRPSQSLHAVCFWIFAAPVVWSILWIAVLRPPLLLSIVQSSLLFEFSCANLATPFAQDHLFSKL